MSLGCECWRNDIKGECKKCMIKTNNYICKQFHAFNLKNHVEIEKLVSNTLNEIRPDKSTQANK